MNTTVTKLEKYPLFYEQLPLAKSGSNAVRKPSRRTLRRAVKQPKNVLDNLK